MAGRTIPRVDSNGNILVGTISSDGTIHDFNGLMSQLGVSIKRVSSDDPIDTQSTNEFNCFYQRYLDEFNTELGQAVDSMQTYVQRGLLPYVPIDRPWVTPSRHPYVRAPRHFPTSISNMLEHFPLVRHGSGGYLDYRQVIIDFLDDSLSPEVLKQLGCFMAVAGSQEVSIAKSLAAMVHVCSLQPPGAFFHLSAMLDNHTHTLNNTFFSWLTTRCLDAALANALSVPYTAENINHLLHHIWIKIKPSPQVKFAIEITPCSHHGYTPKRTSAMINQFIDSLPGLSMEELVEDDLQCALCKSTYGETGDGKPEVAVRLPCGHVLGESCLRVYLSPKPEGWEYRTCPLCTKEIPIPWKL